jgi:predicted transcriptional regulator
MKKNYCNLNESFEFDCKECPYNDQNGCDELTTKEDQNLSNVKETIDINDLILSPLQRRLIKLLRNNGKMNRREITLNIQLPRTTIYDNLQKLIIHRIVKKRSYPLNHRGRPEVFFSYCGE